MKKVLLVSEKDTITGAMKTGPRLRYESPPEGYQYLVYLDPYSQSGAVRNFSMNFFTNIYMLLKAVFLRLQAIHMGEDLVHSFFWTFYRYRRPWIHENDQSPSQLLSGYFNMPGPLVRKYSSMIANILNTASAVITWSNYALNGFIADGVDRRLLRVIRLPMDVKENAKAAHQGFNFLFIGREQQRKGGDLAIRAVESLVGELGSKDIRLIYIGRGSVPDRPWITHYTSVPTKTLRSKIYPVTDVLLYPSRAEAYGMAVLEALSYGIPVITLDTGPLGETVADGVTGFVCKTPDCLADSARRLYLSPSLHEAMSMAALRYVKENHSRELIRKQMQAVYDGIS